MFPLKDDNPTTRFPILTLGLILINSALYLVRLALSPQADEAFMNALAFRPALLTAGAATSILTLVTSQFLHGGLLHLGGNMLYLWIFGDNVEDRFGHAKFVIFYLICGLAATFAQLTFSLGSDIPNLGASGAIAGVLGAYILMFPQGKVSVLQGKVVTQVPALIVIGLWIVLQFFSGIGSIANSAETGGVAYMAHIGGFVAGFVLALLLRGNSTTQPTR